MTERERLEQRLRELERQMGEDDFWDDQDRAAKVSREHAEILRKLGS